MWNRWEGAGSLDIWNTGCSCLPVSLVWTVRSPSTVNTKRVRTVHLLGWKAWQSHLFWFPQFRMTLIHTSQVSWFTCCHNRWKRQSSSACVYEFIRSCSPPCFTLSTHVCIWETAAVWEWCSSLFFTTLSFVESCSPLRVYSLQVLSLYSGWLSSYFPCKPVCESWWTGKQDQCRY